MFYHSSFSILRQQLQIATDNVQFPIEERNALQNDLQRQKAQNAYQQHMMLIFLALTIVRQNRIDKLVLLLANAQSWHAEFGLYESIYAEIVLSCAKYSRLRIKMLHDVEVT